MCCRGERHDRPICGGSGNELIGAVGKFAVEVELHRKGTRLHVPRTIRKLVAQQELDALSIRRTLRSDKAGFPKRYERLARGICIAG